MAFIFRELDATTRHYMFDAFDREQVEPDPFRPANWCGGDRVFIEAMERAITLGNEESLTADLDRPEYWIEQQIDRRGRRSFHTAAEQAKRFAQTDFLTWYVAGMSHRLEDEGELVCRIYRAAPAYRPRGECLSLEGQVIPVEEVQAGHRARYHPTINSSAFSIPVGPNCHHAIERL